MGGLVSCEAWANHLCLAGPSTPRARQGRAERGGNTVRATGEDVAHLRVERKLSRTARGAITLSNTFGDGLVCVRHRVDPQAAMRYVTVELLVQQATISPRREAMLQISIHGWEEDLQRAVRVAGGRWDSKRRVWHVARSVVHALSLMDRVVPTTSL